MHYITINYFKFNAKLEKLIKKFCDDENSDHKTFLFHTQGNWQGAEKLCTDVWSHAIYSVIILKNIYICDISCCDIPVS